MQRIAAWFHRYSTFGVEPRWAIVVMLTIALGVQIGAAFLIWEIGIYNAFLAGTVAFTVALLYTGCILQFRLSAPARS